MNRRLTDAFAAFVAMASRQRYGDVIRNTHPIKSNGNHIVRCAECGQSIGPGEQVQHVSQGPYTSLWAHPVGECPDLYDAIKWWTSRELDFVLRELIECAPQRCKRCGVRQENTQLFGVAHLPELWTEWVCKGCVRK